MPVSLAAGFSLVGVCARPIAVVCLVVDHELPGPGPSAAVAPGVSCSAAGPPGPTELSPCLGRWQVDFYHCATREACVSGSQVCCFLFLLVSASTWTQSSRARTQCVAVTAQLLVPAFPHSVPVTQHAAVEQPS